jgi:hypothetical protein
MAAVQKRKVEVPETDEEAKRRKTLVSSILTASKTKSGLIVFEYFEVCEFDVAQLVCLQLPRLLVLPSRSR